jgi:ubiquinone/menaquinone biosynthesis C-methylase UbiE
LETDWRLIVVKGRVPPFMRWFFSGLGEFRFKRWLDKNAYEFLVKVGVRTELVVLDFGCGSGTYVVPAAKLVGEAGRVYALDISRGALDRVEKKAQEEGLENIVRIDASVDEGMRLEDGTIDLMLMIDVLQEIDDKEALLDEAYRILKPGGVLTIYPMHVTEKEIERLATTKGFTLKDRKFQRRILIFWKEPNHIWGQRPQGVTPNE